MAVNNGVSMYQGVTDSTEELLERHASLVKRIAHHLLARLPSSVQLDDLVQAGLIGLIEASRNYDSSKGASFETYAGIRIRGSMIDEVRRGDWAPRSVHRNARKVQECVLQIERRTGRDATDREVATVMGISIEEYHDIVQDSMCSKLFSLDELLSGEDGMETPVPSAVASPLERIQRQDMREALAKAIAELPERERLVLALYYDEELNLKEIGQVLGVSESRVSQIHSQAAVRLRARLGDWARDAAR
jgi:RNA polymerase sigma factor for flagellar operon FliA